MAIADGEISTAEAMSLLLMTESDELKRLQKAGFIKPAGKDSWRLADLVRGFAKWSKESATLTDSRTLARCWGLSATRISQFVAQGLLRATGKRGQYSSVSRPAPTRPGHIGAKVGGRSPRRVRSISA